MARDRNFGVHKRQAGDCGPTPEFALYYSGATTAVPTLEFGNIVFTGATSAWPIKTLGVDFDGPTAGRNVHQIVFNDIKTGGAGVRLRAAGADLKQRYRFECLENTCNGLQEKTSIEVQVFNSCEFPLWETWNSPKEVFTEIGCIDSCTQRVTLLAAKINADVDSPVVATVVGTNMIEIEAKFAGMQIQVISYEGLTTPDQVVPNFKRIFTSRRAINWFGPAQFGLTDADINLSAVEIYHWDRQIVDRTAGTSNAQSNISVFQWVERTTTVVFNPANTNSQAAYTALVALLNQSAALDKRLVSTTPGDFAVYPYCIQRTDANTAGALATAQTDYVTGNVISLGRTYYQGTKSYYTIQSKSATPPTAIGSDTIVIGYCGPDDLTA